MERSVIGLERCRAASRHRAVYVCSKFAHANHQQPKQSDVARTSSATLGAEIASHMLRACSFEAKTDDGAGGRSLSDFSSNRFVARSGKQHRLLAALSLPVQLVKGFGDILCHRFPRFLLRAA